MGCETGGSISGIVIPKTQKMELDTSLLNSQHYKARFKWSNPGKGVALSSIPRCSSYWKGSFRVDLDYGRYLLMIFICLRTVIRFQVFLSNTNNYTISNNYFSLMIVIYLRTIISFYQLIHTSRMWHEVNFYEHFYGCEYSIGCWTVVKKTSSWVQKWHT